MRSIASSTPRRVAIIALLALAGPTLPAPVAAQTVKREFEVRSGERLMVDLTTGGTIRIEGWDREVVAIDAMMDGRDCDIVRLDAERVADGVEIRSGIEDRRNNTRCSIDIEVRVPRRFDLDLGSMGGSIAIAGVEGDARGRTMGGDLELTGLRGSVRLTTMGGDITLTDSDVDGEVHTMGGRVLLEEVIGDVEGTSMGGDVVYRRVTDRAGKSSGDEVLIHTMGGSINVDDAPAGANVETMGGDIRVRSAAGHVKARTMGGRVRIDAVDGWVEATTMGGDIEVRMVGDAATGDRHVTLVSMSGDITLEVPADLSMAVDITLAYTRNSRGDYRIESDFPIRREETQEWDYGKGSPRKYIYGTGTIAGGRNRIRIETVNGDIRLKRVPAAQTSATRSSATRSGAD